MQNLPGLRRCKLGTCELCGGFFHQGGVTGFVKNRAGDGGMRSRHVSICDECLKQVQLDGSEIKPAPQTTEMSAEGKEFWANLKQGTVKGSIVEGKESKILSEVRRLRNLLTIERSARSDLVRIKEQFANDPLLLGIYSSSVQYALDQATEAIDEVFGDLLGVDE